jgi:hypothetical protein
MPMAVVAVVGSGCSRVYFQNRLNDALDLVEPGITFSEKPGFMVFTDCYSAIPIGFSYVEGKKIGLGNRQFGVLDYEHKAWGVLALGSYKQGVGKFNPEDPHQARKDQRLAKTWPTYSMGAVGLMIHWNPHPFPAFFECDKSIHIGWVGLSLKYRWLDLADFILGWTTLDFMGDDLVKETPKTAPAKLKATPAAPKATPGLGSGEKKTSTAPAKQPETAHRGGRGG